MRYYSEERVLRLIHDGSAKCRKNIDLSANEGHIDSAVGMCNAMANSVVAVLNNEDYRLLAGRFNIHRKWCAKCYGLLQAEITELDNRITARIEELSNGATVDSKTKIGFNS